MSVGFIGLILISLHIKRVVHGFLRAVDVHEIVQLRASALYPSLCAMK